MMLNRFELAVLLILCVFAGTAAAKNSPYCKYTFSQEEAQQEREMNALVLAELGNTLQKE
jgi:hypothetical protein